MTPVIDEHQLELATIIHDLRNPLAAIVAQTQYTRRRLDRGVDPGPACVERALSQIQALAHQMTAMLDDALATTGHAASDAPGHAATADLGAILRHAADQVQQATGQRRIRVELLDRAIVGPWEPGKLGRAVVNLLENALRYSPDGGAVVVAARQDGAEVVVTVRDEGIGIPATDLPRLFEPYARGSNARDRFAGTGLGLASTRHLVESAGGSLAIASVERAGTTVTIRLPA